MHAKAKSGVRESLGRTRVEAMVAIGISMSDAGQMHDGIALPQQGFRTERQR